MTEWSTEQLALLAKEDQGPLTKSIVIVFTTIAFVCVCLRLYTRLRYLGRVLGWEDLTIVISMVLAIITSALQILRRSMNLLSEYLLTQARNKRR